MLGRLFRQNSQSSISTPGNSNNLHNNKPPHQHSHQHSHLPSPHHSHHQPPSHINSYEDAYTRTNLYGTSDASQLKPHQPNHKFFRVIISQDGGSLRSKQVLYDSSSNEHFNSPNSSTNGPWSAQQQQQQQHHSSNNSASSSPSPKPAHKSNKHILTSKIHHNASELNDYMFGCGLPTNESVSSTKLHILPTLNNSVYGSYQSVLITKLFSIPTTSDLPHSTSSEDALDITWNPHPALPIKDTSLKQFVSSLSNSATSPPNLRQRAPSSGIAPPPTITSTLSGSGAASPSSPQFSAPSSLTSSPSPAPISNIHASSSSSTAPNNISSRFSIGLIIPLESVDDDISDVIYNNWDEISHYLIVLQKTVTKKLVAALNNSTTPTPASNNSLLTSLSTSPSSQHQHHIYPRCPFIVNRRIQFPSYMLQSETDLNHQTYKLIKLIHYNSNIPKLINSNSLIQHSISYPLDSKYNAILINWILEILNWLEFKDGKTMNSGNGMVPNNNSSNFNFNSQFHQDNVSSTSFHEQSQLSHLHNNNTGTQQSSSNSTSFPHTSNMNGPQSMSSSTGSSFLASLLAFLIPLREKLTSKPVCASHDPVNSHKEVTRVVIMTGNPMVAKKLIFIINALIPDNSFLFQLNESLNDIEVDYDEEEQSLLSSAANDDLNNDTTDLNDDENDDEDNDSNDNNAKLSSHNANNNSTPNINFNNANDNENKNQSSNPSTWKTPKQVIPNNDNILTPSSNTTTPKLSTTSNHIYPSFSGPSPRSKVNNNPDELRTPKQHYDADDINNDEVIPENDNNGSIDIPSKPDAHDDKSRSPQHISPSKPIPIKKNATASSPPAHFTSVTSRDASNSSSISSSLNRSTPSVKGWNLPNKAEPSTTFSAAGKPPTPRVETSTKNIPIVQESSVHGRRLSSSKSSSMAYLSSSLNSSLSSSASNYSLSRLGGSFMEKWRNSFTTANAGGGGAGGSGGNSNVLTPAGNPYQPTSDAPSTSYNNGGGGYFSTNHHANASNSGGAINQSNYSSANPHPQGTVYDSSEYIPQYNYGSLSKRSSIQSMRTPSPAVEHDDYTYNNQHSINSNPITIGNLTPVSSMSSQAKLSRTQSMFDLYNMNNNLSLHGHSHMTHDRRYGAIHEESSRHGGAYNNHSGDHYKSIHGPDTGVNGNNSATAIAGIKRTRSSVITPVMKDKSSKNINDINKARIQTKCSLIMNADISIDSSSQLSKNIYVEPFAFDDKRHGKPGGYDPNVSGSSDGDDSFFDQGTVTSSALNKSISTTSIKPITAGHPPLQLYKKMPLLPNVAFVDEFRSEFTIQSCPANPKLESQVMTAMKNDLLFYQNNCEYERVTSRTVFISLRAREIKFIEMNVGGEGSSFQPSRPNNYSSNSGNASNLHINTSLANGKGTDANSHGSNSASVSQSPLSAYFKNFNQLSDSNGTGDAMSKKGALGGGGNGYNNMSSTSMANSQSINNANTSYKTTIKKVFTPHKNAGDRNLTNVVESTLEDINQLFISSSRAKMTGQSNEEEDIQQPNNNFNQKLAILISNLLS